MRMPARALGSRYGAWLMFSMPPAIMMLLVPALIWSWAMMTACMPEPHILLMVVQPLLSGIPAARDACRAGAWPRPAGSTQPMMISCISAGCRPARSMAALMETAPSSGERTELKEPIMPPIGVLAEPAITMSFLFMIIDLIVPGQGPIRWLCFPGHAVNTSLYARQKPSMAFDGPGKHNHLLEPQTFEWDSIYCE